MDNLTPERATELADKMASWLVKRGLETPAVIFLEMHKPLAFLAGQGTMLAMPLIAPIAGTGRANELSDFLGSSDNIDLLIRRIEELADQNPAEVKEAEA